MYRIYTAFLLVFLGLSLNLTAHAQPMYNCPDLWNRSASQDVPLTQGLDGWFFRDIDLKENIGLSPETFGYFERLNSALKQKNIKLVFVLVPSRMLMGAHAIDASAWEQSSYDLTKTAELHRQFLDNLRDLDILAPDLLAAESAFRSDNNLPNAPLLSLKQDIHWAPQGARMAAIEAAKLIKELPDYDDYTHKTYKSRVTSEFKSYSQMYNTINELCADTVPPETFDFYQTTLEVEKNEEALFGGQDEKTHLALAGTSFSALEEFNFAGFLAEATQLDVADYAISGGGAFNSIISYVSSPTFATHTPDILVWEGRFYNYNQYMEQNFRQIIPAIYGECSEEHTLATTTKPIEGTGKTILFNTTAQQRIWGDGYYLYLSTHNPLFNQFNVVMDYEDGDGEIFPINRSEFFEHGGRFFVELSSEIEQPLTQISLQVDIPATTQIKAKLCKKTKGEVAQ